VHLWAAEETGATEAPRRGGGDVAPEPGAGTSLGDSLPEAVVDGRYVLSDLLGEGGMGRVYLAADRLLGREVALKVLRERYAQNAEFVGRFEREARAAASLNYPNIVQVYDLGTTSDGTYYIAMEHVPGATLKDKILKEGPLEDSEAVRLASQIADALGVAHARGIVHRDVKPQNVLLGAEGDAKVADFGVARAASATSSVSSGEQVLGTAKYMSPEQATGDRVGPASDLYSLGVVLYEMLTGEVPFDADSEVGVAMKHVNEAPRPPSERNPTVPEGLDAVVMKLLQKRPEDRYPGAAELVADLGRLDEGLPPIFAMPAASASVGETTRDLARFSVPAPVSRGPGGPPRGFVRIRRGGRRRSLAILVALLATLGLAVLTLLWGQEGPVVGSLSKAAEGAERVLNVGEGEVSDVVGLAEREARERLAREGFGVVVEPRVSSEGETGEVLEQSVASGREVQRGSRIALAVGSGPRSAKAPRLIGLTPAAAERRLEEAGLEPGQREEAPSERVPAGEVVAQDPAVGEGMKGAVEVDLTVSSGPSKHGNTDGGAGPAVSGHGVRALPTKAERGVGGAGIKPGRTEPPSGRGDATSGGSAGDDQYR
jgi:eukaryotic-like serine/threonine-protein kinase